MILDVLDSFRKGLIKMDKWRALSDYIYPFAGDRYFSSRIAMAILEGFREETKGMNPEEFKDYVLKRIKESNILTEFSEMKYIGPVSLDVLWEIKYSLSH